METESWEPQSPGESGELDGKSGQGSPKPVPLSISLLVNILRFNRISEVLFQLEVYGPSGHAALSPSLIHSSVKYLLSTYCVDTNCSHN